MSLHVHVSLARFPVKLNKKKIARNIWDNSLSNIFHAVFFLFFFKEPWCLNYIRILIIYTAATINLQSQDVTLSLMRNCIHVMCLLG